KAEDKAQASSEFADIRVDEIPDIPFQNFLYRGQKVEEESKQSKAQEEIEAKPEKISPRRKDSRNRRPVVSASGRKLKGRGVIRFRSRSRSTTPPHWKQEQRRAIPMHKAKEMEEKKWSKGEAIAAPSSHRKEEKKWNKREDIEAPSSYRQDHKATLSAGSVGRRHHSSDVVEPEKSLENGKHKRSPKDKDDSRKEKKKKRSGLDMSSHDDKVEKKPKDKGPKDQSEDSDIETGSGCEDGEITSRQDNNLAKERSKEARSRREKERNRSDFSSPDAKKGSRSERHNTKLDKTTDRGERKDSQKRERRNSWSKDKSRGSRERRASYSTQADSSNTSKSAKHGQEESLRRQEKKPDRFEDATSRQRKNRSRTPKRSAKSKWNDGKHSRSRSRSPAFRRKPSYDGKHQSRSEEKRPSRSQSKSDTRYKWRDERSRDLKKRRPSESSSSEDREDKRRKKDNSSPGKTLKNGNRADKLQNPLDEASLSMLQETEAFLKAQLAAENIDESLSVAGSNTVTSNSKILYKLDSGEQIQYNVTSDHQSSVTAAGDRKQEGQAKSRALARSSSRSRSQSSSRSSSRSRSRAKELKAKVSRDKKQRRFGGQMKWEPPLEPEDADRDPELSQSLCVFMSFICFRQKHQNTPLENAPRLAVRRSSSSSPSPARDKHRSRSHSSSRSVSHSRSGSESPSHLRASLLEQKRHKASMGEENIRTEPGENGGRAAVNEERQISVGSRDVINEDGQLAGGEKRPAQDLDRDRSRSSSSSPEPPPVIPRVHRSHSSSASLAELPPGQTELSAETVAAGETVVPETSDAVSALPSDGCVQSPQHPADTPQDSCGDTSVPCVGMQDSARLLSDMPLDAISDPHTSVLVRPPPLPPLPGSLSAPALPPVPIDRPVSTSAPALPPVPIDRPVATSAPALPPVPIDRPVSTSAAVAAAPVPIDRPVSTSVPAQPPVPRDLSEIKSIPMPPLDHKEAVLAAATLDPLQLANVPLPADLGTSLDKACKKCTSITDLETAADCNKPLSAQTLADTTEASRASQIPAERRSRRSGSQSDQSRGSSSSSSSSGKRTRRVVPASNKPNDKDSEKTVDSQMQHTTDTNRETTKKHTKEAASNKSSKSLETAAAAKSKHSEKTASIDQESSRSKRPSSSSVRSKKQSKSRSRSQDKKAHKRSPTSVSRRRSSSRRDRRTPHKRRSKSRSPRRRTPPRSAWPSRRSGRYDRSPPLRRRSRSKDRQSHRVRRRSDSHSRSGSSSHSSDSSSRSSSSSSD
ncbi:unnamed protein product, partial [Candidula unifasciata]